MQRASTNSRAWAALTLALVLSGCASTDIFDANERWFSKPFQIVSANGGYSYSELKEAQLNKPVTANDLVDANGSCPPPAGGAAAGAAAPGTGDGAAGAPAASAAPAALLGGGIALGMTECDVVWRAGAPSNLQLGSNQNGDRTLVLTYNSGPRPGIYRFEAGRLTDMDRVDVPEPPPPKAAKKKKKPASRRQVSLQ